MHQRIHKWGRITYLKAHEYLIMLCILTSLPVVYTESVWPPMKNFELALVEKGRHQNHYPLQHDEEEDGNLENAAVSRLTLDTHLGNNNEKEKK